MISLNTDNLFKIGVIIILGYLIYKINNKTQEMMTVVSSENVDFDKITILPICKNMTPDSLLAAYDFDIDRLSAVLISLKINPDLMRDKKNYPKISSYLIAKGLLTEYDCIEKTKK